MTRKRFLTLTLTVGLALALSAPSSSEIQGDFPEVVLFAKDGMTVEASATVVSGDVVVNAANGTLSFGNKAKTPAGWEVKANSIAVGNNVTLAGSEQCNAGNLFPCDGGELDVPVYTLLPVFQIASPAGADIDVPNSASATLDGDALDITLGLEGTLNVTPGVHNVRSITGDKKADLVFTGPTELRIAQNLTMGVEANINLSGPAADQVVIYVGGSAALGPKSEVNANFWVPEGTLELPGNIIATGAFLARELVVGSKASVTLDSYFINRPPVARDDSATTNEDTAVVIPVLANDEDPNNDLLTVPQSLLADPANGTATTDGINVTYTPDADSFADDTFNYQVCDNSTAINGDNCATAAISITVISVNDPPVVADQSLETDTQTVLVIDLSGTDVENDALNYTLVSVFTNPAIGALTNFQQQPPAQARVTFLPSGDGSTGSGSFVYKACDDGGLCDQATVTVGVAAFHAPPNAVGQSIDSTDATVAIFLEGSDPESTNLAFSLVSGPNAGGLTGLPEVSTTSPASIPVTYTPSNPGGADGFVFQVCDDGMPVKCDTAIVTINTTEPPNQPPLPAAPIVNTNSTGDPVNVPLSATDPNAGDNLTFTVLTPPDCPDGPGPCAGSVGLVVSTGPTSAQVTYTPATNIDEADRFVVEVCDDGSPVLCSTAIAKVNGGVESPNDPPTPRPDTIRVSPDGTATTLIDGTTSLLANDNDPNAGQTLSLDVANSPVSGPAEGTVMLFANGTFSYTNTNDAATGDQFVYQVCDDGSPVECATTTVFVQIIPDQIDVTVSTVFLGDSSGGVVSQPPGIDCGNTCTFTFDTTQPIGLLAIPAGDSVFAGWSGDQDCLDGSLTPNRDKNCVATFDDPFVPDGQPVTIDVVLVGNGAVVSDPAGITCINPNADCSEIYAFGTRVLLRPRAAPGWRFAGYTGSGPGGPQCLNGILDGTLSATCTATFEEVVAPTTLSITVLGTGAGSVTSRPAGISCSGSCSADFADGTVVELYARPDNPATSVFDGWGGDCAGEVGVAIEVTVSGATSCTATFNAAGQ